MKRATRDSEWIWLVALLALHVLATCWFLPPTELIGQEPLFHIDYPVHTHRAAVYESGLMEGGLPWGYDPAVGAGMVVSPYRDIGAKPIQVLGVILPGVSAATVVRLFLFFTVLLFPAGCLLASRLLGFEPEVTFWIAATALGFLWLSWTIQLYLGWGLVSFVAAAAFTPLILGLFTRFCRAPGVRTYSFFTGSLAALLLLHIQGPWPLAVPLALLVVTVMPLPWAWRTAAVLAPLFAVGFNAFWLIPAYLGSKMPAEPLNPTADYPEVKHLTLAALSEFTAQIDGAWMVTRFGVLALAILGSLALWKRYGALPAWSFGLATLWSFCLSVFGSFMPFFERYQPVRFIVPALVLLAIPLGTGIATLLQRVKLDTRWARGAFLTLAVGLALFTFRGPKPMPLPPSPDALGEFVSTRTRPSDRLAIQSKDGLDEGGFEARAMALAYQREVIGCTYPKVALPAQFLGDRLLGRLLPEWTPEELAPALRRWGITWVFTRTEEARHLLHRSLGIDGTKVGPYRAFKVPGEDDRFLIGSGRVRAAVNRLELEDLHPVEGLAVLRYRFHPAWKTIPTTPIEAYPIPEDAAGFIALRNPPERLTLKFDSRAMLQANWPDLAE